MISIKAYAKVNLSLEVCGKREDGYHILDTVMQTVSLFDTVTLTLADKGIIDVYCDNENLSGESNLCHQAARLFFEESGIDGGCRINIEKNIPVSAGLGGGSADAAAVLNGLNALYGNPFDINKLKELALPLGADVPFLIEGGTARAKGIGEELEPINNNIKQYFLLIKEGEKQSTAYMYKKIDELNAPQPYRSVSENMAKSLNDGDFSLFTKSFENDFSKVWNYEKIKNDLIRSGAQAVSLSGSGPTVMGVFKTKEEAIKSFERMKGSYSNIYIADSVNE